MLLVWNLYPGAAALAADGSRAFGRRGLLEFAESWAQVMRDGHLAPHDLHFLKLGDSAVVTGRERGGGLVGDIAVEVDARMTIVLHRDAGEWRVVHYHSDFVPEVHDAVLLVMAGLAGAVG
jgi:ketosteroid isomerase-like protein